MQRHTPYPSKPLPEESSNRSAVLNLRTDRWHGRACTLRMSSSQKRVGSGTWEIAEVCGDCTKYFPISSWPRREVHGRGVGSIGNGGIGHLERQEQILLWRQADPTSEHPTGCYESFAGLPEVKSTHGRTKLNMGRDNTLCTWRDSALYVFFSFQLYFFQTQRL